MENESDWCDSQQGAADRSDLKGVDGSFEESEAGGGEEGAQGERDCGVVTKIRAERD